MKNAESGKGPAEMRGQFQAIQNSFDDIRARLIKERSTKGVAFPAEAR
jgi:hypothetical protein